MESEPLGQIDRSVSATHFHQRKNRRTQRRQYIGHKRHFHYKTTFSYLCKETEKGLEIVISKLLANVSNVLKPPCDIKYYAVGAKVLV